ncbi:MAG: pectate lyase [Colwellia sp.]
MINKTLSSIFSLILLAMLAIMHLAVQSGNSVKADIKQQPAISLAEFFDVIKHWRDQHPNEIELNLAENDSEAIADNLLLYQRNNGGWPTNKNPLLILSKAQKEQVLAQKNTLDSSLDNRNTYPQIRYLASAYHEVKNQTKKLAYKKAAIDGLNYILRNQYNNGGWAHSPPSTQGYRSYITFADEVMPGTLTLLRDIAKQRFPFNFLDEKLVKSTKSSWQQGERLLLDLQVKVNGRLTIWAGQYHPETLVPISARSYELAGLQTWESVAVVNYLMAEEQPSASIIKAINSAVTWLEENKIESIRLKKVATEPIQFKYFTSTYDLFVVDDANAPSMWARFYDLTTQQPFMANRDGTKVFSLAEVKRNRRTGYDWYGYWPEQLLSVDYPRWALRNL